MSNTFKNILIGVLVAITFSLGGYFLYPKIHKVEKAEDKTVAPQTDNNLVNTDTNSTQTTIKEPEPVAATPKKEDATPPPEPKLPEGTDRFIVSLTATNTDIANNLLASEYIKNADSFVKILDKEKNPVTPGAYKISHEMTDAQLDKVLHNKPYMKWVVIKPGLRKEEIAQIIADTLGWTKQKKTDWINKDTTTKPEYTEGVYYPDTYLIPVDETGEQIAKRLIAKFNENFYAYLPLFTAKNIKWTTALTLASIVQREAASASDMPLIAGILWNRLNSDMYLGVDATLQYVRGDKGNGWWAPISVADKQLDSPYNTYKNKGLPPHPISNPGISAIDAVLHPTQTDCLYYLHDKNHITHCSKTYEEHLQNIQTYLSGNTSTN